MIEPVVVDAGKKWGYLGKRKRGRKGDDDSFFFFNCTFFCFMFCCFCHVALDIPDPSFSPFYPVFFLQFFFLFLSFLFLLKLT
ncbi:hypothetical protein F5X96DRAFT_660991 [Biscogniauxia mediterranea]|nr:hypothetical protein F5X96DRAFT_660991 [Biscogniauxia mediterranea]